MRFQLDTRKARKEHNCNKCSGIIEIGDEYDHLEIQGTSAKYPPTYNFCMKHGKKLRTLLENEVKPVLKKLHRALGLIK